MYDSKAKTISGRLVPNQYHKINNPATGKTDTYYLLFACFEHELERYALIDTLANAVPDLFYLHRYPTDTVAPMTKRMIHQMYVDQGYGKFGNVCAIYINSAYTDPQYVQFKNSILDLLRLNASLVSPAYSHTLERAAVIDYFDHMVPSEVDPGLYIAMDIAYVINTGNQLYHSSNEYMRHAEEQEYGVILKVVRIERNVAPVSDEEPRYTFIAQYVYPFGPADGHHHVQLDDTMFLRSDGEPGLESGIAPCLLCPNPDIVNYTRNEIDAGMFSFKIVKL